MDVPCQPIASPRARSGTIRARRHGVEDDLTDDGERLDDEEARKRGQAKEPPVVHPRGGRPAERLDDDGRQDDLAQSALVEQTTPQGPEIATATVAAVVSRPAAP